MNQCCIESRRCGFFFHEIYRGFHCHELHASISSRAHLLGCRRKVRGAAGSEGKGSDCRAPRHWHLQSSQTIEVILLQINAPANLDTAEWIFIKYWYRVSDRLWNNDCHWTEMKNIHKDSIKMKGRIGWVFPVTWGVKPKEDHENQMSGGKNLSRC